MYLPKGKTKEVHTMKKPKTMTYKELENEVMLRSGQCFGMPPTVSGTELVEKRAKKAVAFGESVSMK